MDHPYSTLRYVAAKDLEDKGRQFANVPVIGSDGEKLGNVEGFIIDTTDGLARHVAVEAGWFIHKHFLIPVGHASIGTDGTFVADITKIESAISRASIRRSSRNSRRTTSSA